MFSAGVVPAGDAGRDLAAAAVAAMSSVGFVRSAADAMELEAVATLATVRRTRALAAARAAARQADVARGLVPGTTRPGRVDLEQVDRCTAQEVSVALTVSPVVARARLELAVELVHRRPATFEALRRGEVDLVRARRICDAVRSLGLARTVADADDAAADDAGADDAHADDERADDEGAEDEGAGDQGAGAVGGDELVGSGDLAGAVESEVLRPGSVPVLADRRPARPAGELTPAQLGARLARLVLRADPDGALERTALADARRGCSLQRLPDGMALLSVTGRAELLGAAFTRLDSTARQLLRADARGVAAGASDQAATGRAGPSQVGAAAGGGTTWDAARTLDQTRVDVFLATVLGDSDDLTRAHNVTVELALLAPAGTVLAGGDEPGDLDGHGPVPAPLVRALAADARWRRWTTDPSTGHVTGAPGCAAGGPRHDTYRPSNEVAALVRARDQTCRFPTCRRRAMACDLDHVTPFPHGPTCRTNLATECRLHHVCKHQGGFSLTIAPDGTTTWTTPTGQQLSTHPPSWGRPPPGPQPEPGEPDPGEPGPGEPDPGEPDPGEPDPGEPPPF